METRSCRESDEQIGTITAAIALGQSSYNSNNQVTNRISNSGATVFAGNISREGPRMTTFMFVSLLLVIAISSCGRTNSREKVESLCVSAYQKGSNGDFVGAIADTSRAIRLDPKSVKALTLRGMAEAKMSDFKAAVADYDEAIRLNPAYENLYFYRAIAKEDMGDIRGAVSDFSKAIEYNGENAWAYENRGWAKVMADKDFAGGAADCDRAVEIDSSNASLFLNCGEVKRVSKNYGGAMDDFDKALKLDQHNFLVYLGLGLVQDDLFHLEPALTNFERSLALNPAQYEIAVRVYLIRTQLGHRQEVSNEVAETIDTPDYKAEKTAFLTENGVLPFSWALSAEYIANIVPENEYLQSASNSIFMANKKELANLEAKQKEQLSMAFYYAGTKHLINGDSGGAMGFFQKCVETGPINYGENGYDERDSAEAELEAFRKSR